MPAEDPCQELPITENTVVDDVATFLRTKGFRIERTCSTNDRGTDLVAIFPPTGQRLFIEAKGGTSSKARSRRFGRPFTSGQAKSHVAVALYYILRLRQRVLAAGNRVGLAFPDNENHRKLIAAIEGTLQGLDISVFFVDADHKVRVQ